MHEVRRSPTAREAVGHHVSLTNTNTPRPDLAVSAFRRVTPASVTGGRAGCPNPPLAMLAGFVGEATLSLSHVVGFVWCGGLPSRAGVVVDESHCPGRVPVSCLVSFVCWLLGHLSHFSTGHG